MHIQAFQTDEEAVDKMRRKFWLDSRHHDNPGHPLATGGLTIAFFRGLIFVSVPSCKLLLPNSTTSPTSGDWPRLRKLCAHEFDRSLHPIQYSKTHSNAFNNNSLSHMYSFKVKIYLLYSEREHMTNDLKKKKHYWKALPP